MSFLMPLSGILVLLDAPETVLQKAVNVAVLVVTLIWMLPQLCWKVLAPPLLVSLPFWFEMPLIIRLVGFGVPLVRRHVA